MIGSGSLKDVLYHLDSTARIWLWHQRLGNPSFLILQRMFHELFLRNNVSKFQCETRELSNHHYVSFSPRINESDGVGPLTNGLFIWSSVVCLFY
jgi:hypothetical protein